MKKLFTILVILISAASLFASFDYRLELLSFKPTFKESSADRSRPALDFQYAGVYKGYPEYFYQNENKFTFNDSEKPWRVKPFFAIYHIGETLSLFRNTFTFDSILSPISLGLEVHGSLTSAMEGEVADTIGYDGVYFYGLAASFADKVALRFGYNHYCSHYGDGTYKYMEKGSEVTPEFGEWYKYLRMDSLLFGLSVNPIEYVRLFGEVTFDMKTTHVIPEIFSPSWADNGTLAEGVPSSYNHLFLVFGAEVKYPIFKNLGFTSLSYQVKAYEEGKIAYKEEDLAEAGKDKAFYDPDRPWEFEHTFNLSQKVNDILSFDVTWHMGRFIVNMYYSTRTSYVSVGARLNFDTTVTLFDTAE